MSRALAEARAAIDRSILLGSCTTALYDCLIPFGAAVAVLPPVLVRSPLMIIATPLATRRGRFSAWPDEDTSYEHEDHELAAGYLAHAVERGMPMQRHCLAVVEHHLGLAVAETVAARMLAAGTVPLLAVLVDAHDDARPQSLAVLVEADSPLAPDVLSFPCPRFLPPVSPV